MREIMRRLGVFAALGFAFGIVLQEKSGMSGYFFLSVLSTLLLTIIIFILDKSSVFRSKSGIIFSVATFLCLCILGMMRYSVYSPGYNPVIQQKVIKESLTVRKFCENRIARSLHNENAEATAIALTLGDKSLIDKEIKESYINAGVMHALALSGLHVGIIWSIVQTLLSILHFNIKLKRLQAVITIVIISIYVLMTGLSPSAVRAGIMLSIWKIAELSPYKSDKVSSLSFAALIILVFDPATLFKLGFQLSFAATAGIIFIYPIINQSIVRIFPYNGKARVAKKYARKLSELAGISVACTIATLPMTLLYFGGASSYFLLSNIIVMPIITLSVYSVAAAAITAPLPLLGKAVAAVTGFLLNALESVIRFLGS